jgi:L-ascorbate metabolism protein UlaG (beta-lactamase superfamily)
MGGAADHEGATVLERVRAAGSGGGSVAVSWLGQAGFALRAGETVALIDPFLSPYRGRAYESSLTPAEATGIDLVLVTHEHIDHFDAEAAPVIAAASPGALFVVPTPIVDMVTKVGVPPDRVVGAQPGDRLELAGLAIHPVPARHGVTMDDAYGFGEELSGGLVRFLGYVVDAGGVRLYHAGDTIHYAGMETRLADMHIDLAMLPINGRDPERESRNIVGNLNEREAAWLAREIRADLLVPMHYDLFDRNRGYPALLVHSIERDHSGVPVYVPARDRAFVYTAPAPR